MPAINLYEAYHSKRRKFGVNDSPRFRESFAEAVNLVHSELNAQVFGEGILPMLSSFDDVIDKRLGAFTKIAFDEGHRLAIGGREYWSVEYDFEVLSATNSFTDTMILSSMDSIVLKVENGVFSIASPDASATAQLPETDAAITILFSSNRSGNRLLVNSGGVGLAHADSSDILLTDIPELDWVPDLDIIPGYSAGTTESTVKIGTVTSRELTGISGLELKRTRFYSASSIHADFHMSEGTGSEIVDSVAGNKGVVTGGRWMEVYSGLPGLLGETYRSVFNMGLDYHLQDGGEWAIEPDVERERKWYMRGMRMARDIRHSIEGVSGPLGIST